MSDAAIFIEGTYFDGSQPVGLPALLSINGVETTLAISGTDRTYRTSQLAITPRIGSAGRFISLPDGSQVHCADHPCLDLLTSDSPSEGPVAWLEQRIGVAIGCVALIVALLLCAYVFGLPIAANWAITKVSGETERALGKDAFAWLDNNQWFEPTELDKATISRVKSTFSMLAKGMKFERNYHLEFRRSKRMRANAVALPGGIVVITDEMVSTAGSNDEIAAVLAHEMGHIELRHAMKQVMEGSVLAIIAGVVTSDASSYTVAVAGLPALLAQTQYSRECENEADDFAFRLLKRHNMSPAAFASLMERLSKDNEGEERNVSFLSTHPVTSDRVKRARQASGGQRGE